MERKSIIVKISITLVTVITAVLIFWSLITYFYRKKELVNNLNFYAQQAAERLSNGLSFPLWTYNDKEIEKLILFELVNENVLSIIVRDAENKIYLGKIKDNNGNIIFYNESLKFLLENNFLSTKKEIYKDKELIGYVEIYLSKNILKKYHKDIIIKILHQTFLINLIIIFILSHLISKLLIKRIVKINNGIKKIEKGDYTSQIIINGNDEITNIADNINNMAKTILEREKQLVESSENIKYLQLHLSSIIESMPTIIISLDEKNNITQWNSAAEKLFNIPKNEALNKCIWDLVPSLKKYINDYNECINTNSSKTLQKQTLENLHYKLFNISIFPLIYNNISGGVFKIDDITENEKIEQQLRQSQKMEMIGTLAGGLAHDFNNVLGGIIGTLSLMQFKLKKSDEIKKSDFEHSLSTLETSANRAADIIQRLLTLSKKQDISFHVFDLQQTIKNVVKILHNTFDKSVEIAVSINTKEKSLIKADPTQIEQILLNLCINAYHAMTIMRPPGSKQGGILSINLDKIYADKFFCKTHLEAKENIYYWLISIKDTGVGMSPRILTKIFEPFFTTKEKNKGTGLGLSMVYNIVQQHNGFIDVYSEVGLGSTFNVYLPADNLAESENIITEETQVTSIKKGVGTILVIDDEVIMRETAKAILEECGYKVMLASNGEEGVNIYRENYNIIDAVLLDMVMPKKSGKDAYIEMKKINSNIKVILASGFKYDERVESIMQLGVQKFLQKPFTLEKLSDAFYNLINNIN